MDNNFDKDNNRNEEIEKTMCYNLDSIKKETDNKSDTSQNSGDNKNSKSEKKRSKAYEKAEQFRLKEKGKSNRYFFRTVWLVMIVLVSIFMARYMLVGINDMLANNKDEKSVNISIPPGSNLSKVSDILYNSGVIGDKSFFKLYTILTNSAGDFTNGDFEVKTNMDYEALINYLQTQSNRTDIVKVTFTEGMNVIECAQLLEENEVCSKEDFLKVCASNDFDEEYEFLTAISNANQRYYKLEGYLFPDTYQFYKYEDPHNTVERFLSNFSQKLQSKQKVSGYDQKISIESIAAEKSMSLDYLINVASIIQAEAANTDDMYMVASVLYNRLNTLDNGGVNSYGEGGLGLLGMDSTVFYPYRSKAEIPSDIVKDFKSSYNTYNIEGLPPGPICNPGVDAIDAALNPESTDYYYFCHSEDGTAYYAKTMSEHEANIVKAGLK